MVTQARLAIFNCLGWKQHSSKRRQKIRNLARFAISISRPYINGILHFRVGALQRNHVAAQTLKPYTRSSIYIDRTDSNLAPVLVHVRPQDPYSMEALVVNSQNAAAGFTVSIDPT